jgi:hypothetical protein
MLAKDLEKSMWGSNPLMPLGGIYAKNVINRTIDSPNIIKQTIIVKENRKKYHG